MHSIRSRLWLWPCWPARYSRCSLASLRATSVAVAATRMRTTICPIRIRNTNTLNSVKTWTGEWQLLRVLGYGRLNCSFRIVFRRRAAYSRSRSFCRRWRRWRMRSLCSYRSHHRKTRCTRQRIRCASHLCTRCTRAPTRRHSSSSNQTATIPSKHIADGITLAHCVRIRWWWVPASNAIDECANYNLEHKLILCTCRATTIDAAMAFRPRAASRR